MIMDMDIKELAAKITIKDEILCDINLIDHNLSQITGNKARVAAARDKLAKIKTLLSYSNDITTKLYTK